MAVAKKRTKKSEPAQNRPPLQPSHRNFLFSYLLSHEELFERAKLAITPESFAEDERWLALVWDMACEHHTEHRKLPASDLLATKVGGEVDLNPAAVSDEDIEQINELLNGAYARPESEDTAQTAAKWLQYFLEDRLVQQLRDALSLPQTPKALSQMLTQASEQAVSVSSVTQSGLASPFAEGWDAIYADEPLSPTGLSFIDSFLGGGSRPGECNGLMGPVGGGKTTIGCMLCGEAVKQSFALGAPFGYVYQFLYEDELKEVRPIMLSYMAKIPKSRLQPALDARDYSLLSHAGRYVDYERQMYQTLLSQGGTPPGEYERYQQAITMLNACWRPVYMGGDVNSGGLGAGLVDELVMLIRQDLASAPAGTYCKLALADYVLAAVRRHLAATGQGFNELRHYVTMWPGDMRRKLGGLFHCPVWALHQLAASANSLKPGKVMTSAEASESKSFAENCHYCFTIGTKSRENRAAFNCSKCRRTGSADPIVVTLKGDQARLVDSRHQFMIDSRTHSILRADEVGRLHGDDGDDEQAPVRTPGQRRSGAGAVLQQQRSLRGAQGQPV